MILIIALGWTDEIGLDMFITVKSDGKYSFHPVKPVSVARQVKWPFDSVRVDFRRPKRVHERPEYP